MAPVRQSVWLADVPKHALGSPLQYACRLLRLLIGLFETGHLLKCPRKIRHDSRLMYYCIIVSVSLSTISVDIVQTFSTMNYVPMRQYLMRQFPYLKYLIGVDWINIYSLRNMKYDRTDRNFILKIQIQSTDKRYTNTWNCHRDTCNVSLQFCKKNGECIPVVYCIENQNISIFQRDPNVIYYHGQFKIVQ